jgi:hypothetical protein
MVNRAAGEYKQWTTNHVTIDELRLRDEKTGVARQQTQIKISAHEHQAIAQPVKNSTICKN